jgi:hypothetical protein
MSDVVAAISPASFWVPDYIYPSSAWIEHAPFAFWLCETLRPRLFVQLGTHYGYSYFTFCQAIDRLGLGTVAYAVDTWKGDEHARFYDESVFRSVETRNREKYATFSSLIRSTFDDAVDYFSDGSVDLLHIDGRHFYNDVMRDFMLWRQKLTEEAVVLFHDTNVREHEFSVWKFFEKVTAQYPSFQFFHGHGLGVLIPGDRVPPPLAPLFEASRETAHQIRAAYAALGVALRVRREIAGLRTVLADRDLENADLRSALADRDREIEAHKSGHHNALALLETEVESHVTANEFDTALRLIHVQAVELFMRTLAKGWISGSERLDLCCLSIGRKIRDDAERRRPVALGGRHRRVYVVSELYREGGHTRLLEDLIDAGPHADHQIIWTEGERPDVIANMAEILRVKEIVPLHVLRGEPVERLRGAFAILTELCPDVLMHLGHPNDPIAIALMQPGIARRRLMIHHCDSSFALGRSLEGTVHVALGRHFQDFARREWALDTVLLPLTCREPVVAKEAGWARDRPFVTVTTGSWGKFDLNGKLSYLDVLTERFSARDGIHVHIGSLLAEQKLRIEQHLDKICCRERFVHREHVPHLASALSELAPSVYIDSYPVGGGKAIIEAMAAGLPICAANHDPNLDSSSFCYPERFWWTHPIQVGTILAGLDPTIIERHSALSRSHFERNHSPKNFKRLLQALLD